MHCIFAYPKKRSISYGYAADEQCFSVIAGIELVLFVLVL